MAKKSGKIGFPMPTAKTRFHILDLHLKKHIIIEKKTPFLDVLLLDLYNII